MMRGYWFQTSSTRCCVHRFSRVLRVRNVFPVRANSYRKVRLPNAARQTALTRRGAVMTIPLVAVLVCTLVIATMARSVVLQRTQLERNADQLAAEWFAEAGLERACSRMAKDSSYRGDEWTVDVATSGTPHAAVVRATVSVDRSSTSPVVLVTAVATLTTPRRESPPTAQREVRLFDPEMFNTRRN